MRRVGGVVARKSRSLSSKCHYDVLGVKSSAPVTEIKTAYLQLAKQHHPDISTAPGAESRFKDIAAAFDVIGNRPKRAAYDQERYAVAQGFHYAQPEPYRTSHGASGSRKTFPGFRSLGPAAMAMAFVLLPLAGLVAMGFSTFQTPESEPPGMRRRGVPGFSPAGTPSGERRVPACFNRKTGMWEEYDYHTMHKYRGRKVQYIPRDRLNKTVARRQP